MTAKTLTGRKVFMMFAGAFSIIISVNLLLAYKAVTTFPGLEVKNSYVASQSFDEERSAQLALGWDVSAEVVGDQLRLVIVDQQGTPVKVAELETTLGRATHIKNDSTPAFDFDGTAYVAPVELDPGNWNLRMVAIADDGTKFHQRIVLYVKPN
ncbi:MAG: FixH family protein [Paracoccaceae bacterium]